MKQKIFVILLVAVVVLGGVIGGAFAGGIAIGKSQGKEEANQDLQSRFSQFSSRFGEGGAQPGMIEPGTQLPEGLLGRGGTMGTVEKIEGSIITLSTVQGALRVQISDSTAIQKMGEGSLDDIAPGESISVSGERNEDGSIEATGVFILTGLNTQ